MIAVSQENRYAAAPFCYGRISSSRSQTQAQAQVLTQGEDLSAQGKTQAEKLRRRFHFSVDESLRNLLYPVRHRFHHGPYTKSQQPVFWHLMHSTILSGSLGLEEFLTS